MEACLGLCYVVGCSITLMMSEMPGSILFPVVLYSHLNHVPSTGNDNRHTVSPECRVVIKNNARAMPTLNNGLNYPACFTPCINVKCPTPCFLYPGGATNNQWTL